MRYVLIDIDTLGLAYQEIANGSVVRYADLLGATLFAAIPAGLGSAVVDANPTEPAWALADALVVEPVYVPPARRLTKLAFTGLLGDDFRSILTAAKQSVDVEMFVKMLDWATPDPDGTSVDLDDPRVIGALQMLESAGLIGAGRASEILNA